MKAKHKLRMAWSKRERDVVLHYPLGEQTVCDARWLAGFFNDEFCAELVLRGYDPETIRFSVEPHAGNPKFASERNKKEA
jgi:hypothetical protein